MNKNVIRFGFVIPLSLFAIACSSFLAMAADAPSVDTLKQVLDQRLQKLRPVGTTERNILFQEVRAGTPNNMFQVTATIRDYGPGYPANHYYGETCVGHMDKWPFELKRDAFGGWQVYGAMTVTMDDGHQCKPNPSAGVSSIPLASLPGSPAPSGPAAAPPPPAPAAGKNAAATPTQPPAKQYHCVYFVVDHLVDAAPFTITGNSTYTDSEGKRGTYSFNSASSTVTFRGGNYDGQRAEYETVAARSFTFSVRVGDALSIAINARSRMMGDQLGEKRTGQYARGRMRRIQVL